MDSVGCLGSGQIDWIPAPFVKAWSSGYEAAADAWYVSDTHSAPWAAIGRLAVQSVDEANSLVDKLVAGSTELAASPTHRMLIAADSYAGFGTTTDAFERTATELADLCRTGEVQADVWFKSQSAAPSTDLRVQVNAGVDVLGYVGHGSLSGWSSDPVLVNSATANEWSGARPFIVFSWTCFDGAFVGPWAESVAWSLVRSPHGGPIAAMAATTMEDPEALGEMARQLLCKMTSGQPDRIGDALRLAKGALAGGSMAMENLLLTYGLLGDPTTPNPWR